MIPTSIMRLVRVYGAKLMKHIGKLYVISSDKVSYEEMCRKYFTPASQEDRVIPIEPCYIKTPSEIADAPLANVVEETGANLIGEVLDSEQGAPTFLIMRASKSNLSEEADVFAFKIDNYNRNALGEMMENMAINDPEVFQSFMKKANREVAALKVARGGRKTAAQKAQELETCNENFVKNMQIIRFQEDYSEDEVILAKSQVKMVLSNMSHATLSEFMYTVVSTGLIPDDNTIEERFLNLDVAAKKSDVHLLIRPRTKEEKMVNSDGKYHLTFSKGENAPKHIRFPGKVETAIFYTVMVARKSTGADSIEILNLEKEFIGIYRALYVTSYEEAKTAFDGIRDCEIVENGVTKMKIQGRYRNYIPNIRTAVNEALSGSDNPAIYHYAYHYEKGGRFHVATDHITLDDGFIKEMKRLQDPKANASYL